MSPKEKAKNLIDKFDTSTVLSLKKCIDCAIICVDEILNQDEKAFDLTEREYHFAYWQQVKEELNNL